MQYFLRCTNKLFLLIGTKEWKLSIAENKDNYIVESDDKQHIYETNLAYLYGVLDKVPYIFDSYLLIIFICFIL